MRFSIAIVSLALILSSCGSEEPTSPATSSPSSLPSSPSDSPDSASSGIDFASTENQSGAPGSAASGSGGASEGEALFKQPIIADSPGCITCHSLEPGVRMIGPTMADAVTVATGAVQELSAEDYLRQSIVEPNAHVAEGFMPDLMPQDYSEMLSEQQINDLVAFLMTQT